MKTILISIYTLILFESSLHAKQWSSKKRTIVTTVGGCGSGLLLGAYLDSQDDSSDKSSAGTLGINTAAGCVLGLAWSVFFQDDDQSVLIKENDKLSFELEEANKLIRKENYRRVGSKDRLESIVTGSSVPSNIDFDGLRARGCHVAAFKLMKNGKNFVPVSENIILPNVFYYLVSKDKDKCVMPDARYGLLDDIITGIGSALHNAADDAARDRLKDR